MASIVAVACFLLSLGTARHDSLLECWDDCFDAASLQMIGKAGVKRSHSFTSVFDRRREPRSVLECAIQSLLRELNTAVSHEPSDFFVEYWWRDPDRVGPLEAHRDKDETLCRRVQSPVSLGSDLKIGVQRCPNYGHVLYVTVENVLAPTLVFEEEDMDLQRGGPPRSLKTLWCVPACSSRLLRFRGDCLHAVSHPPLEFLDGSQHHGETASSASAGVQRRAVLLFNTWEKPPLYPACGEPLVTSEEELLRRSSSNLPMCRPQSSWMEADVALYDPDKETRSVSFLVPLLGDFSRRGCVESSLVSLVDENNAIAALSSTLTVHALSLRPQTLCQEDIV